MRIEIQLDATGASRAIAALGQRARNLRPLFAAIGDDIVAASLLGFKDSRDPYGQPWKPLAPATIARRRKGSSTPLLDTGRLRNSITRRVLAGGNGVEIGSNVIYAAIHNFGGRAGRGHKTVIPQRAFVATAERGLPREYGEIIRDRLAEHFSPRGLAP